MCFFYGVGIGGDCGWGLGAGRVLSHWGQWLYTKPEPLRTMALHWGTMALLWVVMALSLNEWVVLIASGGNVRD